MTGKRTPSTDPAMPQTGALNAEDLDALALWRVARRAMPARQVDPLDTDALLDLAEFLDCDLSGDDDDGERRTAGVVNRARTAIDANPEVALNALLAARAAPETADQAALDRIVARAIPLGGARAAIERPSPAARLASLIKGTLSPFGPTPGFAAAGLMAIAIGFGGFSMGQQTVLPGEAVPAAGVAIADAAFDDLFSDLFSADPTGFVDAGQAAGLFGQGGAL